MMFTFSNALLSKEWVELIRSLPAAAGQTNFPPYNIRKISDRSYQIELALAGYNLNDITIDVLENVLRIRSNPKDDKNTPTNFVHQGLTYKSFLKAFTLNADVQVRDAEFINGILRIFLEWVPKEETNVPKLINIRQPTASAHPQLLNEESSI